MSGAKNDSRARREPSTFEIQEQVRSSKKSIQGWERGISKAPGSRRCRRSAQGVRGVGLNYYQKKRLTISWEYWRTGRGTAARAGRRPISLLLHAAVNALVSFKLPGKVYEIGPIICGNCSRPFKLT